MLAFDQSNEQPGGNTVFTKTTLGLAVILVTASGALSASAQQHPWVPSADISHNQVHQGGESAISHCATTIPRCFAERPDADRLYQKFIRICTR
jgi:hypothetical protein